MDLKDQKHDDFQESYLKAEFRDLNPGPLERMEQEVVSLYTIPAAYVRDWYRQKKRQFRSLMNRDHWRYTNQYRLERFKAFKSWLKRNILRLFRDEP